MLNSIYDEIHEHLLNLPHLLMISMENTNYQVLEFTITSELEDIVSFILLENNCLGCHTIQLPNNMLNLIGYFSFADFNDTLLVKIKSDLINCNLANEANSFNLSLLKSENWLKQFSETLKPIEIGKNLTIIPVIENESFKQDPQRLNILIEPAMAFGTGLHITTKFCLTQVEMLAKQSANILDLGTGSGILAIASALINEHANIIAIDNDEIATMACYKNMQLNNLTDKIKVITGELNHIKPEKFQLVLANLTAYDLQDLLPQLASKFLHPNGYLVLSGILTQNEDLILTLLPQLNLKLETKELIGEWTNLVLTN